MKRFIYKFLIFTIPFVVVLVPLYISCEISGEIQDVDENIEKQLCTEGECLYGMAYNEQTAYYKLCMTNRKKAAIMALGTSRVMQFKQEYFLPDFYNAGGAVGENYDAYLNFLENVDQGAKPDILIIGLDSWVFNDNWNVICTNYTAFEKIEQAQINKSAILKSAVKDYIDGKWRVRDLENARSAIGLNAIVKNDGFMKDGSRYSGFVYLHPEQSEDWQFKDTFDRIAHGERRFEYGEVVDADTIIKLRKLLQYCKKNEIYVIGFLPPFAPSVFDAMMSGGNYHYLDKIEESVKPIFESYDYEFYNFQDGAELQCDDSYFTDGFHGGEVAYAIIVESMLRNGSVLEKYVDRSCLQELLDHRFSNLVFEKP